MAENDIYNSKSKYENFVEGYITKKEILQKPNRDNRKRKYYCKNPDNLKYYHKLIRSFEIDDLSYVRRYRLMGMMNLLTNTVKCDLKDANSVEKDAIF